MAFRDDLIMFIREDAGLSASDFDDDTALFSDGLIDSFTMASLMEFIEEKTGVEVGPADVTLDNLDSVSRIVRYVETVLAG